MKYMITHYDDDDAIDIDDDNKKKSKMHLSWKLLKR